MFMHLGRFVMLIIWGCLIYNAVVPFPKPLNYFLYFALIFMTVMHALKVLMISFMVSKSQPLCAMQKLKLFIFGVFELIPMYKRQQAELANQQPKTNEQSNLAK